jgi:hypothetical protein
MSVRQPLLPRAEQWSLDPVPVEVVAPPLTGRFEFPSHTVAIGHSLSGYLVFENKGDAPVSAGCSTHRDFRVWLSAGDVVLENPLTHNIDPLSLCQRSPVLLQPGTTKVAIKVAAKYFGCSPSATPDPALPRCVGRYQTPPLPPGRYQVVFRGAGALGSVVVPPTPIQVGSGEMPPHGNAPLPKIAGASPEVAREQFDQLYFTPGGSQIAALGRHGATVISTALVTRDASGPRLVIGVRPGPGADVAVAVIRSLFEHPEFVDVEQQLVMPQ